MRSETPRRFGQRRAADLFSEAFSNKPHVVLAVSGGSDSLSLMHLAAGWLATKPAGAPRLSVVTIDHKLRAQSATEAAHVARAARDLGLDHATLVWGGEKPKAGVQAAAREARYDLISQYLNERKLQFVATAHTADDQAETLVMRLARGSGVEGLAAMKPEVRYKNSSITILRPLLTVKRSELQDELKARGIAWFDDPSNANTSFERPRIRAEHASLNRLGLRADALVLSSRRLSRANDAIEAMTRQAARRACVCGALKISDLGYARLDWTWLIEQPAEVRIRMLARLIAAIGGSGSVVSLGQLEAHTEAQQWQMPAGLTLAGAKLSRGAGGALLMTREYGRVTETEFQIAPGQSLTWDRRFRVWLDGDWPQPAAVYSLGDGGLQALKAADFCVPDEPKAAMRPLPAFWHNGALISVPQLGFYADRTEKRFAGSEIIAAPFA